MNVGLSRSARLTALWTLVLLSIPLVAMQFTREVNWDIEDFVAAGVLQWLGFANAGRGFVLVRFFVQRSAAVTLRLVQNRLSSG